MENVTSLKNKLKFKKLESVVLKIMTDTKNNFTSSLDESEELNVCIFDDVRRYAITDIIGTPRIIELTNNQLDTMFRLDIEPVLNGLHEEKSGDYMILNADGIIEPFVFAWWSNKNVGWVLMVKRGVNNPHHPNFTANCRYALLHGFWGAD